MKEKRWHFVPLRRFTFKNEKNCRILQANNGKELKLTD